MTRDRLIRGWSYRVVRDGKIWCIRLLLGSSDAGWLYGPTGRRLFWRGSSGANRYLDRIASPSAPRKSGGAEEAT